MIDLAAIAHGLRRDSDGIWYAGESSSVSYPADGNDVCFAVEEGSFWFGHRNRCITSLVTAFPPPASGTIFDVGGGNGFVALGLHRAGFEVVLVEPGRAGCLNARQRGLPHVVCATTETAGFARGSLPAIGLFDVVEHLEDDTVFLRSMRELLQPGGRVYLSVPAYRWLWSGEDVAAGHFRRYTRGGLVRRLAAAGFEVEFASYFFRWLPLPIFLLRTVPHALRLTRAHAETAEVARDHLAGGGPWSRRIERWLAPEVERIAKRRPMAFGGSCLVAARKR